LFPELVRCGARALVFAFLASIGNRLPVVAGRRKLVLPRFFPRSSSFVFVEALEIEALWKISPDPNVAVIFSLGIATFSNTKGYW
jgi:hypothetical protein